MFNDSKRQPAWIWGVLLALVLIIISVRGRSIPNDAALKQRFESQPTTSLAPGIDMPDLNLDRLPSEAQQAVRKAQEALGQGQGAPALTPVAQSARLRVEVHQMQQHPDGVQVLGRVTNISDAALEVPVSAFELHDSAGGVYVAEGGANVQLNPGASTPLDLTVPLPAERGLMLTLVFPPDPPVEQVLLLSEES